MAEVAPHAAVVVGMSLGGYLSQLLALKAPPRVRTLTLIASERLALADPKMPAMDPRVPAYHARAAELDWTHREAVIPYQIGAWRLLTGASYDQRQTRPRGNPELTTPLLRVRGIIV